MCYNQYDAKTGPKMSTRRRIWLNIVKQGGFQLVARVFWQRVGVPPDPSGNGRPQVRPGPRKETRGGFSQTPRFQRGAKICNHMRDRCPKKDPKSAPPEAPRDLFQPHVIRERALVTPRTSIREPVRAPATL